MLQLDKKKQQKKTSDIKDLKDSTPTRVFKSPNVFQQLKQRGISVVMVFGAVLYVPSDLAAQRSPIHSFCQEGLSALGRSHLSLSAKILFSFSYFAFSFFPLSSFLNQGLGIET